MNILQKCAKVPELEDRARILRVAYLELSGWDKWMPVSAFYELAAVEMVLERGWWVWRREHYQVVQLETAAPRFVYAVLATAPTLLEACLAALEANHE